MKFSLKKLRLEITVTMQVCECVCACLLERPAYALKLTGQWHNSSPMTLW